MQADLKRYGYDATVALGPSGQQTWHLVQIGGFADRGAAAGAAADILKRTGAAGLIIKTPSS
jgi:cell division septation protein DedD